LRQLIHRHDGHGVERRQAEEAGGLADRIHQPEQIVDGAMVARRFLNRFETHLALVQGLRGFRDENA